MAGLASVAGLLGASAWVLWPRDRATLGTDSDRGATMYVDGDAGFAATRDASDAGIARLRKADLRPAMKTIAPLLSRCYEQARANDPQISGVIETQLLVHNEPGVRLKVSVEGFDTAGPLGESRAFLDCVTTTFERAVLPPLEAAGSLRFTYPTTFAPRPPDNRERQLVDDAHAAADAGRWDAALAIAERGLRGTSLGTSRSRRHSSRTGCIASASTSRASIS